MLAQHAQHTESYPLGGYPGDSAMMGAGQNGHMGAPRPMMRAGPQSQGGPGLGGSTHTATGTGGGYRGNNISSSLGPMRPDFQRQDHQKGGSNQGGGHRKPHHSSNQSQKHKHPHQRQQQR